MYIYEDIPMLLRTISNNPNERINLLIDQEVLDTDILYQQLFYSHKQLEVDLKLVFNCIRFLKDNHQYDRSLDDLYKMIGILAERLYVDGDEAFNILESYMQMYIIRAYMSILNKDKVTIRDIISLYNINLFTMNKSEDEKKRTLDDK